MITLTYAQAQQPTPLSPHIPDPAQVVPVHNNNNQINLNQNSNNNQPSPPAIITESQNSITLPFQPPTKPPLVQLVKSTTAQSSIQESFPSTSSFIAPSSFITIDVSQSSTTTTSAPQTSTKPVVVEEVAPAFDQVIPSTLAPTQRLANLSLPREEPDPSTTNNVPTTPTSILKLNQSTSPFGTASSTTSIPLEFSSVTPLTSTRVPVRSQNSTSRVVESRRLSDFPSTSSSNATPSSTNTTVQFLKPKTKFKCSSATDCLNGALCYNGVCFCAQGFTGETCGTNIDECRLVEEPCYNNGHCIDEVAGFRCDCVAGYKGDRCQESIDMCIGSPCLNGATCLNHQTDYSCNCELGWEGRNCEKNIDECLKNPCQNNATCFDLVNDYKCDCGSSGFVGKNCEINFDDCAVKPCSFGAKECIDLTRDFKCICHDGFTGKRCDIDIDECQSNPCGNNGICIQKSHNISDLHKMTMDQAIQHMEQNNISHYSINMSLYAGHSCECKEDYYGERCEEKKKCSTKSVAELCGLSQAECVNIASQPVNLSNSSQYLAYSSYECLINASFDGSGQSYATYKVIGEFNLREIYVKYRSLTGGIIMSYETTQSESPTDLQLNKTGLYLSGAPIKRDEAVLEDLLDGTEKEIRLGLDTAVEIKSITLTRQNNMINEYHPPFKGCLMQVRLNNQLVPLLEYGLDMEHSFEITHNTLEPGPCRTCFDKDCLNHGHCASDQAYEHCVCPSTFTGEPQATSNFLDTVCYIYIYD